MEAGNSRVADISGADRLVSGWSRSGGIEEGGVRVQTCGELLSLQISKVDAHSV